MSGKAVTGYGRPAKNARTASATFGADGRRQLLARRAPHAGQAAERREQRAAAARSDAGHVVELRVQIAHRARAAMERHREAMRFVADPLQQQQRRIVCGQRDRIVAIARVEQLLLLGDADARPDSRARAPRAPRRPPRAGPCRRRSGSGPETARLPRAACGSGGGRLRASRRSRRTRGWRLATGVRAPGPALEVRASSPQPRAPSPGCGTSDTPLASSARLRTRPSTRRSRCPESSRCRSTRCGAAAPAARGRRAASRARRTARRSSG